jgi:hypothetical protein
MSSGMAHFVLGGVIKLTVIKIPNDRLKDIMQHSKKTHGQGFYAPTLLQ